MPIKYTDCPKCRNKGRFFKVKSRPVLWEIDSPPKLIDGADCDRERVYCDCQYGQDLQVIDNRIAHPEYENPFGSMSDSEIIETLNRASDG